MVIAPAEGEAILSPDQLRADLEVAFLEAGLDRRRELAGVPDVGDVAREQRPGRAPVRLVVVVDLAELARVQVHAGAGAPGRVIIDAVGRVGDHESRGDTVQRPSHVLGARGIAADQPVATEDPHVTQAADRVCRSLGRVVRVGQPGRAIHGQRGDLVEREAGHAQVEIERLQIGELDPEQRLVPTGVQGELVVGDDVGALLGLAPAASPPSRGSPPTRAAWPP